MCLRQGDRPKCGTRSTERTWWWLVTTFPQAMCFQNSMAAKQRWCCSVCFMWWCCESTDWYLKTWLWFTKPNMHRHTCNSAFQNMYLNYSYTLVTEPASWISSLISWFIYGKWWLLASRWVCKRVDHTSEHQQLWCTIQPSSGGHPNQPNQATSWHCWEGWAEQKAGHSRAENHLSWYHPLILLSGWTSFAGFWMLLMVFCGGAFRAFSGCVSVGFSRDFFTALSTVLKLLGRQKTMHEHVCVCV